MMKLFIQAVVVASLIITLAVPAMAGSPAPDQTGFYVGKASIQYVDLATAKMVKMKAYVEVNIMGDGTVFISLPTSPSDSSNRVIATTGNFGPASGLAINGSSSTSTSLGFTFKGTGAKTVISLVGSVTLDTSENFTMAITAKKLKKQIL